MATHTRPHDHGESNDQAAYPDVTGYGPLKIHHPTPASMDRLRTKYSGRVRLDWQ